MIILIDKQSYFWIQDHIQELGINEGCMLYHERPRKVHIESDNEMHNMPEANVWFLKVEFSKMIEEKDNESLNQRETVTRGNA